MASYRGSRVPGYTQGPVMGHESLEDQNEQMESDMKDKVSQLKSLSINIGMELKEQDKLLKDMDNKFDSASSIITNTIGKVGKLLKSHSNYHIHYFSASSSSSSSGSTSDRAQLSQSRS